MYILIRHHLKVSSDFTFSFNVTFNRNFVDFVNSYYFNITYKHCLLIPVYYPQITFLCTCRPFFAWWRLTEAFPMIRKIHKLCYNIIFWSSSSFKCKPVARLGNKQWSSATFLAKQSYESLRCLCMFSLSSFESTDRALRNELWRL